MNYARKYKEYVEALDRGLNQPLLTNVETVNNAITEALKIAQKQ